MTTQTIARSESAADAGFDPTQVVAQSLVAGREVDHYVVNLTGSQKLSEGTVWCKTATIYVSGASTLWLDKLICEGKVTIHCTSSSFVHIGDLQAANGSIEVHHGYASSMFLGTVSTPSFTLDVHYSSRLDILGGAIKKMVGSVTHTSFVRCLAAIADLDVWVDKKENRAPYSNPFGSSFIDR